MRVWGTMGAQRLGLSAIFCIAAVWVYGLCEGSKEGDVAALGQCFWCENKLAAALLWCWTRNGVLMVSVAAVLGQYGRSKEGCGV